MTAESSNKQETFVTESYLSLMNKMREILLIIINVTVGILTVYIYPLDRFESQETLISLTLLISGLVTFYYLLTIPSVDQKITMTLTILLLINTTIASIVIDVAFYHFAIIFIFYSSIFILRRGLIDTVSSYFIESMIIFSYLSGIIFWYSKPETSSDVFIIEIILLQILLSTATLVRVYTSKIYQLSFLPFVFNLALLPIIEQIQDDILEKSWLVDHIQDLQLMFYGLLFLLFLIPNLDFKDHDSYSQYFIGHSILLPSIYIISMLYNIEFNQSEILSTDLIINPFSLILISFTIALFSTLSKNKMKLKNAMYLPYISLCVTGFYVLMNLSFPEEVMFLDHGFSVILILLPFLFLYKSSNDAYLSLFQAILMISLSLYETGFVQYIQNLGLLLFISLIIVIAHKFQTNRFTFHLLIFSGISFVSINALLFEYDQFLSVEFVYLLTAVLAITSLIFITGSKYSNLISNTGSIVAWYFLSFYSERDIVFTIQQVEFDVLDVALIILIAASVLSTIIKANEDNIINSVFLTQGLAVVYMLSSPISNVPNYIILGIMVMLPSIQMLIRSDLLVKSQIIIAQSISLFVYQFISQGVFAIDSNDGEINVMTILYGLHISVPFILSILKNIQKIQTTITGSNLLLISFYGFFTVFEPTRIDPSLDHTMPHFAVIGIITAILTFSIFQTEDNNDQTILIVIQSIGVWIIHILEGYTWVKLVDLNNTGIEFGNNEVITSATLILISFVTILAFFDTKNEDLRKINTGVIFGLIFTILIFNQEDWFSSPEPIILIGLILSLKLISNIISKIEINTWSYSLFVFIFIIMKLEEDQTEFKMFGEFVSITAMTYLIIIVLIVLSTMNQKDNTVIYLVISFSTLVLAIAEGNSNGATIQLEFFIAALFTTFILYKNSVGRIAENKSAALYLTSLVFYIIIVAQNDLPQIFDITFNDQNVEYIFITNLSYLVYSIALCGILLKTAEKKAWNYLYINFIILGSLMALSEEKLVHPVIIAISILLFTLPLIFQFEEHIRTNLPFMQGILLVILSYREYTIENFDLNYSLNFSFYIIWSNVLLLMWYRKGISNQLISTISAIFMVAGGYAALFYFEVINYFEPIFVFIVLIESMGVIFVYNSRSTAEHTSDIYRILFSAIGSTFLISLAIRDEIFADDLFLYRMMLDWLLFIPIFIQTVVYARPIVAQIYSDPSRSNEGDNTVLSIMILFVGTSLLIGSEEVFAVKLVVLAMVFWVFAGTMVRPILSWSASLFSIFAFGWIVAQMGGEGEPGEGSSEYALYFLVIAMFGIVMIVTGLINELKYKGEPFTSSLMISGSVLTSVAVIMPLLPEFKSPFPNVEGDLGYDIMNFIPNVVWAILGLFLFVVSMKISKDYLRRIALSILMIDNFKTGYDIFSLSENQLIRIVGSIVLGAVLILIFYLFTLEEGQEQAITQ